MFSLESIRKMNARKDRANARARARRAELKAARANETPEAREARLNAFERDERAAPWVECFDERENA